MKSKLFIIINKLVATIFLLIFTIACSQNGENPRGTEDKNPPIDLDPFERNQRLGRGINLGNALEAPNEGDWGVTLQSSYFKLVRQAGFNSVRIPIRWSTHASTEQPYAIDPTFFVRIDWAINQSFSNDLAVVINIHHYEEIMQDPAGHRERFLALWQQIAEHYKNHDADLIFEILNEPNNALTPDLWNTYLAQALEVIRESNSGRTVIIGTANWGGIGSLSNLEIPVDEQNTIVTVHYYNPFQFTHQGAEWVDGSDAWLGTHWTGSASEQQAVNNDLNQAESWGIAHNKPIYLGEFGAYSAADMTSRTLWTNFVARQAETKNMSWAYWEFCSGFGIYDPEQAQWYNNLLNALIPGSAALKM